MGLLVNSIHYNFMWCFFFFFLNFRSLLEHRIFEDYRSITSFVDCLVNSLISFSVVQLAISQ